MLHYGKNIVFFIVILCGAMAGSAQERDNRTGEGVIGGMVVDSSGKPLMGISVELKRLDRVAITDGMGYFKFENLLLELYDIQITGLGYAPLLATVKAVEKDSLGIKSFVLLPRVMGMKEVIVTARPAPLGSSSVVRRSAIVHTQPNSLADVMQLIPGQLATNPNLGTAAQLNLRQIPTTADAGRANALGTQIVLDGVPLSNNGNLQINQTILNSGPSSLPPFSSVAGRGNDLRQIPADNIEQVEVIRGIPSVRYGDLTSGLVVVTSRMGALKPEVTVRINPTIFQAAFAAGWESKSKRNTHNFSTDFLQARDDIRDNLNRYARVQGQWSWQKQWGSTKKFRTTTIISGYKTLDALKQDPDDSRNQSRSYSDDWGYRFSTEGIWKSRNNARWSHHYLLSLQGARQTGFFQNLVTRDLFPISTATKDTTMEGEYGRSEYLNQTTVDGRPLNAYARLESVFLKKWGNQLHKISGGVEYRMDVNNGAGRQFDVRTPPRQNYSVGERPRSFSEIPALHQLGYYLEDRVNGKIGSLPYVVQAGVRLDNVAPESVLRSKYKTILSPRINTALEVLPSWWMRLGYGVAAKAVPIAYLYGGDRFFDLVNLNYFAANPAERLVIITTRTVSLNDLSLQPYTSRKWEWGIDRAWKDGQISVSAFQETMRGAVGFNREVKPFPYDVLRILQAPTGSKPIVDPNPVRVDTFFAAYDRPVNNRFIQNRGIEYSIDFPEWRALRTSINLTGAFIQTESFDDGNFTDADRAYFSSQTPERIPIFASANRTIAQRLNSSFRLVHRIPAIRMVVSALWQTIWIQNNRPQPLSEFPVAYINRRGENIRLSEEEAKLPIYQDLRRVVAQPVSTQFPPLHLYNIRLTKEWSGGFSFSFYANNFLNQRPLHLNPITGGRIRRNEPLFFGAECTVRF